MAAFSLHFHLTETDDLFPVFPCKDTKSHSRWLCPHDLFTTQRPYLLISWHWGVRISTGEFGEDTNIQSITAVKMWIAQIIEEIFFWYSETIIIHVNKGVANIIDRWVKSDTCLHCFAFVLLVSIKDNGCLSWNLELCLFASCHYKLAIDKRVWWKSPLAFYENQLA